MSDQAWAIVIGFATVVVLRVIDFYFPKGRISKWTHEHSVKETDDEDERQTP